LRKGARLLCTVKKGGRDFPWLVQHKYGNGEVIYCAGKIGLKAFTRGFTRANSSQGLAYPARCTKYHLWVDASDEKWKNWAMELVQGWGAQNAPYLEWVNAPAGMITNVFQTGQGIIVNMLNAGGKQCQRGDEMPLDHEVVYPSVKKICGKFLKLRIRRRIRRSVLMSPDFKGAIGVHSRWANPFTVLEVPTERIRRYAVLVLK